MTDPNPHDWRRVEAALRSIPKDARADGHWNPSAVAAYERTLRKVEQINKTGEFAE